MPAFVGPPKFQPAAFPSQRLIKLEQNIVKLNTNLEEERTTCFENHEKRIARLEQMLIMQGEADSKYIFELKDII